MSGGVALILDIDDTLAESLFKNKGKDEKVLAKEFLARLAKLVPYPYVKGEIVPLAAKADRILVVTGRQPEMANITKRWLNKVIMTNDYTLKCLNYANYDQYLEDKKKVLKKAFADFDDLGMCITIYEDSEPITRWVKQNFDWVKIRKVTNGIPSDV